MEQKLKSLSRKGLAAQKTITFLKTFGYFPVYLLTRNVYVIRKSLEQNNTDLLDELIKSNFTFKKFIVQSPR